MEIRPQRKAGLLPSAGYSSHPGDPRKCSGHYWEAVNKFYVRLPGIVQQYMDRIGEHTGRSYHLFDYYGAKNPSVVLTAMGSSCEVIKETLRHILWSKVLGCKPIPSANDQRLLPAMIKCRAYFLVQRFVS